MCDAEWLINALNISPHDKAVKDKVKGLLSTVNFCRELGSKDTDEKHTHNADCEDECPEDHTHTQACWKKHCNKKSKSLFDHLKDGAGTIAEKIG